MTRDEAASRQVRQVAERAIRRLNVLEYVILAAAAGLALLAGGLAALVLDAALGLPFRTTWLVASLVLFVIPAWIAYSRERKLARERAEGRDGVGESRRRGEDRNDDGR